MQVVSDGPLLTRVDPLKQRQEERVHLSLVPAHLVTGKPEDNECVTADTIKLHFLSQTAAYWPNNRTVL